MDYEYPLDPDWSIEEVIDVIDFYTAIEKAYEVGIKKKELMGAYQKFKNVIGSIAYEKHLDREFKRVSSYSIFQVMKKAKEDIAIIKM